MPRSSAIFLPACLALACGAPRSAPPAPAPARPTPVDAAPAPEAPPARTPEAPDAGARDARPAWSAPATEGEDRLYERLALWDDSVTRQRWRALRHGGWQLLEWELTEPSARRLAGHAADPREPFRAEALEGAPGGHGSCPEDMAEVRGASVGLPDAELLALQDRVCTDWRLTEGAPSPRCSEEPFRRSHEAQCPCWSEAWRLAHYGACACVGFDRARYEPLRDRAARPSAVAPFCVDRFEFPGAGAYPVVHVSWNEAARHCAARGRRLCTETEWTFACEGPEALPFPHGYALEPERCNEARPLTRFYEPAAGPRDPAVGAALGRTWQGLRAGSRPRCASPFGVFDMAGNVDEWTVFRGHPDRARRVWASILKGGYWGEDLNRCRVSTRSHDEQFTFYQIGFRCCASAAR